MQRRLVRGRRAARRRLTTERLEARLNFAHVHAELAGVLHIAGTDAADDISLSFDSDREMVHVLNHDRMIGVYPVSRWNAIHIDARGGDDLVRVDHRLPVAVRVQGGEGSDTLIGVQLGGGQHLLLTSGEALDFDNRSCESVECIRIAEGEGRVTEAPSTADPTQNPSLPTFSNLLRAGHDHGLSLSASVATHDLLHSVSPRVRLQSHASQHDATNPFISASRAHAHGGVPSVTTTAGEPHSASHRTETLDITASVRVKASAASSSTMAEAAAANPGKQVCLTNGSQIATRFESLGNAARELAPKKPGCT